MNRNHHQRTTLRSTFAYIMAAIVSGTTAHAAIVYEEGFNYGASGALDGKNGGTGFSEAWISGNPGIAYSSSGLTFSDLSVSGGMATATGTVGIGNATSYCPLTVTLSGVYYGSFLS